MSGDDDARPSDVEWLDIGPALPTGSAAGRWRRWPTLLFAAALVVGVIGVVDQQRGRPSATLTPRAGTTASVRSAPGSPPAGGQGRAWPTAAGGCGGQTFLPLVSSALPLAERTGLQVSLGSQLSTVDVDHARVSRPATLQLAPGEFVSALASDGSGTVALIQTCDQGAPSRVVRVDAAGQVRQVAAGHLDGLLAGGGHPWAFQTSADNNAPQRLDPLNGGAVLTLPAGFGVVGAYQNLIVGYQAPPAGSDGSTPGPLVVLDPATGQVHATVGPGTAAATISAGLILWSDGACAAALSCAVHRYDLATGRSSSHDYHLGPGTYLGYGLISPDQRLLAFQLHRPAPDPRFDLGHPGTPTDIAVLHLDTGQLQTVPGIELWAKASPGLVFSPDSRWLIIGLDEGPRTRLLLWHPGLSHPVATVDVPGLTPYTTPITARLTG